MFIGKMAVDIDITETFDLMFSGLLENLKSQGHVETVSKTFSVLPTDEKRAEFALSLPEVENNFRFVVNNQLKSSTISKRFREAGNASFKTNEFMKAVNFYSESICWAPLYRKDDEVEDTCSALAFANRSAALYHLAELDACLEDIGQAMDGNYPKKLRYKLHDRKAKCLGGMGAYGEALEELASCIKALEYTELAESRKKVFSKELENLSQLYSTKNETASKAATCDDSRSKTIPTFSHGYNSQFPSLSAACDVTFKSLQGRFIVANRDITPGEIILKEKAFAAVVLPEQKFNHCHHCFKRTLSCLPCLGCHSAKFCSVQCRSTAVASYHQYECGILHILYGSGIGKFGLLAMRAITVRTLSTLLDSVSNTKEDLTESTETMRLLGINANHEYKNDDYATIYHLVTHANTRVVADLFRRSVMAVYLVKCLELTSYFDIHSTTTEKHENIVTVTGLLLSHLQSFPCNAHEISELTLDVKSVATSVPFELGAGIFSTLSLFNHSCDPAVNRNFYGDVCVVRAIKTIKKGEEVSDNYGAVYAVQSRTERQEKLKPQYFFDCRCDPCVNDWPTYPNLPHGNPVWKCSQCSAKLPVIGKSSKSPIVQCRSCLSSQDIMEKMKIWTASQTAYSQAFESLMRADVDAALPLFLSHIAAIQDIMVLPWRELNDSQEAAKQCFSILGNCVKVP